jgi:hypothetical protein
MGITYADIALESIFPKRRMEVKALVDSESVFLTVPQHIAVQLGFDTEEAGTREIILADGSRKAVPMIGPLRVHPPIDIAIYPLWYSVTSRCWEPSRWK